ncbi:hypothetical protein ACI79C_22860 [Geodermatophilus sp. SYSU D00697]
MSTVSHEPPATPDRRPGSSAWAMTVRCSRAAFSVGVVSFALIGALTTPPYVLLVVAPTFGLFIGGVVAVLDPDFPGTREARRAVLFSGMWAALLVPCFAGLGVFDTAGTVAALALMTLSVAAVSGWVVRSSGPGGHGGDERVDGAQLQQLLRVLPTSMLLHEWRATAEHLRPGADPDRRAEAVLMRTLLLEELARRDPVGVGHWLSEGAEDAPEQYLGDDRQGSS